jgi:twitching motility two-component system response regulator PilG
VDPSTAPRPVVLVVDDERSVQTGLGRFLSHFGHRVIVADSVAAAIDIARRDRVGAVTLDLGLNGSNGLDFLVWMRNTPEYATTPVVVLTGVTTLPAGHTGMIGSMHASLLFKPTSYQAVLDQLLLGSA